MSVFEDMAKKVAQNFVGLDDIVLFREIAENGMDQASEAGRSMVGAALVGGGLAARTAALSAQIGAKSVKAATGAAKGIFPGADVAEKMADDVDRRISETGQQAARLAAQGAGIGRGGVTTNPLTGEPWLEKSLGAGERWNTLLADSAVDLGRMVAMPMSLGVGAGEAAASTETGQHVARLSMNALSSMVDTVAGTGGDGSEARAEARSALLALGLTPLASATRDFVDLGEGMTRMAFGDGRKLRDALLTAIDRLDLGEPVAGHGQDRDSLGLTEALRDRSKKAAHHTPERVLAAGEEAGDNIVSQYATHAAAMVEDSTHLGSMALMYSELLGRLGVNAGHTVVNGWRDVHDIDRWVGDDESGREGGSDDDSQDRSRPVAVEQLEIVVSSLGPLEDDDTSRSFYSRAALELARDTVFAYTARAADREQALNRVERFYGPEARNRVGDDCSLRSEVRDAGGARAQLRALHDIASELRREGLSCLFRARNHAAGRLRSLERDGSVLETLLTHRHAERVESLRSFVALVDHSIALEGAPETHEPARQRVWERFDAAVEKLGSQGAA